MFHVIMKCYHVAFVMCLVSCAMVVCDGHVFMYHVLCDNEVLSCGICHLPCVMCHVSSNDEVLSCVFCIEGKFSFTLC